MSKENTTQNGQFELPTDDMSLEKRQAAAFNYIKGYLDSHFKLYQILEKANVDFMHKRIKEQFNIDLKIEL